MMIDNITKCCNIFVEEIDNSQIVNSLRGKVIVGEGE